PRRAGEGCRREVSSRPDLERPLFHRGYREVPGQDRGQSARAEAAELRQLGRAHVRGVLRRLARQTEALLASDHGPRAPSSRGHSDPGATVPELTPVVADEPPASCRAARWAGVQAGSPLSRTSKSAMVLAKPSRNATLGSKSIRPLALVV